ncbi:MAG: hypothetical protein ACD_63C00076G0007 [uncultured bacterium]|nr:MAG: hypothetical protein ACD_63C00076G0007 [uncultured bacterium]
MQKTRILIFVILMAILGASFAVRFVGIDFGTPIPVHVDEHFLVDPAIDAADGDFNPGWFGSPGSTIIYINGFVFYVYNTYENIKDGYHRSAFERYQNNPTNFLILGRILPVMMGTLIVFFVFLLGKELKDNWLGLIAAFIAGGAPYLSGYARIIHPDITSAFFVIFVIWASVKIIKTGKLKWYLLAGVGVGLATATKYPTVMSIVPLLFSHGLVIGRKFFLLWIKNYVVSYKIWIAVGAFIGTFLFAVPYFIPEFKTVLKDVSEEARTEHFGWHIIGFKDHLKFYFEDALFNGFGDFIRYISLFGIVIILLDRKMRKHGLHIVLFIFSFVFFISVLTLHWGRWIIPVIPLLAVLAAIFIYWFASIFRKKIVAAMISVICLTAFSSSSWLLSSARAYASTFTETQTQAYFWQHSIPDYEVIAAETATIPNKIPPDENTKVIGFLGHHSNYLAWIDYFVVNEQVDSRYFREPERYYQEVEIYKNLDKYGRLIKKFESELIRVPFIPDFSFFKKYAFISTPGPTISVYKNYKPSDFLAYTKLDKVIPTDISDLSFRERVEFNVYAEKNLFFSFLLEDANEKENGKIYAVIWRGEEFLRTIEIDDSQKGRISIDEENNQAGVFRVRLISTSDVFFHDIKFPDQMAALGGIFKITGCKEPPIFFMNGTMIEAQTFHKTGLQTIRVGDQVLTLDKTLEWESATSLKGINKVEIQGCDLQVSTNGFLTFDQEAMKLFNTPEVQQGITPLHF